MIVRNYLFIIPILAVVAAAGVSRLLEASRLVAVVVLCAVGANAGWYATVVRSLVPSDSAQTRSAIVHYLGESPNPLYLSPFTRGFLGDAALAGLERAGHVADNVDAVRQAMIWTSEPPIE